jgi:hypothetical protein
VAQKSREKKTSVHKLHKAPRVGLMCTHFSEIGPLSLAPNFSALTTESSGCAPQASFSLQNKETCGGILLKCTQKRNVCRGRRAGRFRDVDEPCIIWIVLDFLAPRCHEER